MSYWEKKVIREHLDKKLKFMSQLIDFIPPQGWIKTMREALGMSTVQLAKKVGVDQSRISRLENAEKYGDLKMSSLQKIAKGLNMKFVYGFVPNNSLEEMVEDQARKIATRRMTKLDNTMRLEKQSLSKKDKMKTLGDMINKILIEEPKNFWD